jgi:hypothetical protein
VYVCAFCLYAHTCMDVWMYVCIHAMIAGHGIAGGCVCMCMHVHVRIQDMIDGQVGVYVCEFCVYACIRMYSWHDSQPRRSWCVCMCMPLCICTCVCVHTCKYVCIYGRLWMYTDTHINAHTYTYT